MNPPPQRGRSSRYGGGSAQQEQQQQFPFVVDPTEAGAGVRAFFPAHGGEPPPPPSSGGHRYHQFGVEGKHHHQDGAGTSVAATTLLPRHSSSPPGFFSSPVVMHNNGFSSARAEVGGDDVHHAMSSYHKKMKSPVNLAGQGTLSHISEDGIPGLNSNVHGTGHSEENITANSVARSFSSGFSIGPWEDSNSIVFSNPASKAGIHNDEGRIQIQSCSPTRQAKQEYTTMKTS